MQVTKKQLVNKLASELNLSEREVLRNVNKLIEVITKEVHSGNEVNIKGFGKFYQITTTERNGVNPKTKEAIKIKPMKICKFKAGRKYGRV